MWIVWCPACLSWGPMGMQGFYRQEEAPSYSCTPKSSSPFWWEVEIAFLTLSQVVNHFNYDLIRFPSNWRHLNQTYKSGEVGMCVHEYHTQARHCVITLGSDWLTHTSHHFLPDITSYYVITSPWLVGNNHHEWSWGVGAFPIAFMHCRTKSHIPQCY